MPNVEHPTAEQIERMVKGFGRQTEFGNYMFSSQVRNRSAGRTLYVGNQEVEMKSLNPEQQRIRDNLPKTLRLVIDYLRKAALYHLTLTMGRNELFTPHCNLVLSRYKLDYSRLGHMAYQTLFSRSGTPGPMLTVVDLPEWQENDRQILVFPDEGITLVLGSDYYGEVKKGFLRMGMYHAKKRGMLGLHAGCKMIHARTREGEIRKLGMILFGLTATGKTTHSCHHHGLIDEGEEVKIIQDDVVFLSQDGSTLGTERGLYIKTDGLLPETQPLLYDAARQRDTILENVMIDFRGRVYFQDVTLTGNGRGIIQRDDLREYKSESLNLPPLREMDALAIAFITRRNTVLPIASKLNPAQAAGAFMLGESVESTGGDPRRAGESVRVVGTNPFIIGSEEEEGNWFYDFLRRNEDKVECYQLNTGGVGELMRVVNGRKEILRKVERVQIPEMAAIIRGICRNTITWKRDPYFGVLVPESVEGVDMSRFDPTKFYQDDQIEEMVTALKRERQEYLGRFPGLHPDIIAAYRL